MDDDHLVLRTTEKLLKKLGLTVTTATNGQDAIRLYTKHRYDGVILDYQMPRLNGLDTYYKLKKLAPNITAFIYTGDLYAKNLTQILEKEQKNLSLVYKPLDIRDFEIVLHQKLTTPRY